MSIHTARLILRAPCADDAPALRDYHVRNAERFARWEPRRGTELARHLDWIAWRLREDEAGRGRSFLAFDPAAPAVIVGMVNLDAIVQAPTRSAMLSYSIDGAYEGRGFAREAVEAVIAYAFGELDLQSLSAHYDAANLRSGGLLRRLGFEIIASTPLIPGLHGLMCAQTLAQLMRSVPGELAR